MKPYPIPVRALILIAGTLVSWALLIACLWLASRIPLDRIDLSAACAIALGVALAGVVIQLERLSIARRREQ